MSESSESELEPPSEFEPEPEPPPASLAHLPRPSLLRLLTEHNPFYLLSAACMLASCLALTNSLSWTSIARGRLLTLIVTLNVYEAALLAIALFLIVRRQLRRDGRILLLLQAFFLADFTFLNAEIATLDVRTGLIVNACLLALAAAKMGIVIRVLRPSFTPLQFAFVVLQLAVLFGLPIVLRWHDANRGILGPRQLYAVWWTIGLLPAAYELLARLDRPRIASVAPGAQAAPTSAYVALPFISLLAHVGILHWVYRVDYVAAHAGPLLLGFAVVLNRFSPSRLVPRKDLVLLRLLLPAAAVMVSWNSQMTFATGLRHPVLVFTPANLTIVGAFLVYVYSFLLPHAKLALAVGAAAALAHLFGPSWQQAITTVQASWTKSAAAIDPLLPKTIADWGVVGLVASFAFLAAGLCLSLRKVTEGSQQPPGNSQPG